MKGEGQRGRVHVGDASAMEYKWLPLPIREDAMQTDPIAIAEHFIQADPVSPEAAILGRLLHGLRTGECCDVQDLYELNLSAFDMAIDVLNAWRLQRYYRGGAVVAGATAGH